MWILPKQLHTSRYVPDMEALISDSDEFSQLCAQSLTQRGKDSAARIWSAKLKRDSWMQLLFGRTLRPSHGSSFVDAWTSSVAATRASHSAQPASDSAPKTHDTSGLTYQPELLQCDQVPVSLKMSKDISRWGCPTSSKTWQEWVTERRGAWRQRVNAARLTSGRGSLSWPTIRASEYKDVGPVGSKSHDHMLGKHYLCAVVTQDAANWPTVQTTDSMGACLTEKRLSRPKGTQLREAVHGLAAPASSSSLGSRQGLSWATPNACDHKGATTPEACKQWESRGQNLPEMVVSHWATPQALDSQGPQLHSRGDGNLPAQAITGSTDTTTMRGTKSVSAGKLNPRWVETLMGLPIGWTMPSCTSPQTIAPTSCDSSAMELCLPPQSELSEFSLASWPSPRAGESQQTDELSRLWVECGYKQPKTRGGKPRANNSTYDVTLETAVRGVAKSETTT